MKYEYSWRALIENEDYAAIAKLLGPLVARHNLVSTLWGADQVSLVEDVAADFFLYLWERDSFRYYLDSGLSDHEIGLRLFNVNLNNMLGQRLRERSPESSRMVQRINQLLRHNTTFQCYSNQINSRGRTVRSREKLYGLSSWSEGKPRSIEYNFASRVSHIPVVPRNKRRTGGGSALVISKSRLVELLVEIFESIDSPVRLKTLRKLVLPKLATFDASDFVSLEGPAQPSDRIETEGSGWNSAGNFSSAGLNPEDEVLASEEADSIGAMCHRLLRKHLYRYRGPKANQKRFKCLRVLWLSYCDDLSLSQSDIAKELGMGETTVGSWRAEFEQRISYRRLSLPELSIFQQHLYIELRSLLDKVRWSRNHGPIGEKELLLRSLDQGRLAELIAKLPPRRAELARLFYVVEPRPTCAEMAVHLGLHRSTIANLAMLMKGHLVALHNESPNQDSQPALVQDNIQPKDKALARTSWSADLKIRLSCLSRDEQLQLSQRLPDKCRQAFQARVFYSPDSKPLKFRDLAANLGWSETQFTSVFNLARRKLYDILRAEDHIALGVTRGQFMRISRRLDSQERTLARMVIDQEVRILPRLITVTKLDQEALQMLMTSANAHFHALVQQVQLQ